MIDKPSITLVGHRCVIVTEMSGLMSAYRSWDAFFKRPDADELCIEWLSRNQELQQIVTRRLLMN